MTTAKPVGYIFINREFPDVSPYITDNPDCGALSPERWERRAVYVLDPEPALEVEIAPTCDICDGNGEYNDLRDLDPCARPRPCPECATERAAVFAARVA